MLGITACSDSGPTLLGGVTTLAEITPPQGATAVDPTKPITARFSGAMGTGMERYTDLHRGDVTGPLVAMSCAWSTDRSTLTCTPVEPLHSGTRYTIYMGLGMMDADGHMVEMEQQGMQLGGRPVTQVRGPMHDAKPDGMAFTFQTR
jgi:hypothetical protein